MFDRFLSKVLNARGMVLLAAVLVCASGIIVYRGLRVDLFPPLNFPILNVIAEMPSFSSLEMERQVTLPLESAAGGVLGVTKVRSTSGTGIAMISVEFPWGSDMNAARQLLLQALASAQSQLPPSVQPVVENLSATLSMIEGYAVRGGADPVALRDRALYELKPRLQRVPGVYKVLVLGGQALEYTVRPNPYLMIKYDLTLDDLRAALSDNNILASPGVVNARTQELVIHTNGQFQNSKEIENAVIAVKAGNPVRVRDVASVSEGAAYQRGDASADGKPAVLVNVMKQPSFDTGAVADAIAAEMDAFAKSLPPGHVVENYYDQAQLVSDSIASVKEAVWIGAILVVIILAWFLRDARTTAIATLSIPLSVLAAVGMMRVFGIGINIMSLGGLAIGTGIIVDDTIIVLENIHRWLSTPELRAGLSHREVVAKATSEVSAAVFVSTLTNIAIFAPMVLVEGLAGRLFVPVSGTVTFALLASLIASVTAIPVLADALLNRPAAAHAPEPAQDRLGALYARTLEPLLRRPLPVVAAACALVAVSLWPLARLDLTFLPALDEGAVLLQTIMPPGTSLTEAKRLNMKVEEWAAKLPGVAAVVRRTGHAPGSEDTDNVNHSDIMVKLVAKRDRPLSLDALIAAMSERTGALPSILVNYLMPLADKINDALGGVPADIGVKLSGPDLDRLHSYSARLVSSMGKVKGLTNLRAPADMPVPSLEVEIDKKAAGRLGISERAIHDALGAFSLGLEATAVRQVQKRVSIVVRYTAAGQNLDLEALRTLPLRTAGGSTVPLEQVAKVGYGGIPSEIAHEHMTRVMTITADVRGRRAKDAAADIGRAAGELKLPPGYSWGFAGKYEAQRGAMANLLQVLALAVVVVALILWFEFRSATQAALVLTTIPLAGIGAAWALWLTGETLNVSSMIGAVLLVGIVVRNGIMLLDYANMLIRQGRPMEEAVRSAAKKRLRPILMTAAVMSLGLVPLAAGWGTGAELQRPLAVAVIGGILTSTLLTLLVLPAAALAAENLGKAFDTRKSP